jgi:hypothetical protein
MGNGSYKIQFIYDCKVPTMVKLNICANQIPINEFPTFRIATLPGKPEFDAVRNEAATGQTFSSDALIFNPSKYSENEIFNYGSNEHYFPMILQIV